MYEKFACCAFWETCQLGQTECVYNKSNPAKMQACGAYQRSITSDFEVEQKLTTFEQQKAQSVEGQLTLF